VKDSQIGLRVVIVKTISLDLAGPHIFSGLSLYYRKVGLGWFMLKKGSVDQVPVSPCCPGINPFVNCPCRACEAGLRPSPSLS
jgi:hypothetical protein